MKGMWGLLLVTMAMPAVGCSPRDHDNPLDPRNPDTGGSPRWLAARADDAAVDLSWRVPAFVDLDAVRLFETGQNRILWVGGAGANRLRDAPVPNGVERSYRLALVLNDGTILDLPEETAVPGPLVPWIYDAGRGEVLRLTPDGRRRRDGFFDSATLSVAAEPDSGFVLVVDFFAGRILLLDRDARERWRREDYDRPNGALRAPGGWWITDSGLASVRLLDEVGAPVYESLDFEFPVDLAPAGDSAVWVADATGPVGLLVRDRGVTAVGTLQSPRALAPAPGGGVWVADRDAGALVRLDASAGEILRLPGYPGVEAIAADPATGGIWVGDRNRRRVVLLDAEGALLLVVGGFPATASLAVVPDGSEAWVADPVLGEIVRLSRTGEVLGRSEGLSTPISLSVAFR